MSESIKPKPTESELEILQILWQQGPCTVRQVHEDILKTKEAGYTTTLKLMQIMAEKGLVKRNEENRTHIYEAAVSEADTQKQMLDKFLDLTFRGSAAKLVMQALGNGRTSKAELDEIRKLLDQIDNDKNQQTN